MGHHDGPVNYRVGAVPLLHARQMQVLKVPVVEEQCFGLIKGNRTALLIVKDM